jgi:hypothetical protein
MTIVLPTLAVAFAALCVWLTVRIVNRRERWAKWTLATTVCVPMLYVLSFGPACWWFSESFGPKWGQEVNHKGRRIQNLRVQVVPAAFAPVAWVARRGPQPLFSAVRWYATLHDDFVFCGAQDWQGGPNDGMIFCP